MNTQLYIGIMSGTSMDGADAVLIRMQGNEWQGALAHAFTPYSDDLRQELLDLQNTGDNELHRSSILSQTLSRLYAQTVHTLLSEQNLPAEAITAIGCHGQTVRHAPEHGYSIQLADLPLLAELTGIFTIGDFRSRDLSSGGQGAPLVPAFHQALFQHPQRGCSTTGSSHTTATDNAPRKALSCLICWTTCSTTPISDDPIPKVQAGSFSP